MRLWADSTTGVERRGQFTHARLNIMEPCIFCGNQGDSKEDLFLRWILKRVQTREPLYRQMGDTPPQLNLTNAIQRQSKVNCSNEIRRVFQAVKS